MSSILIISYRAEDIKQSTGGAILRAKKVEYEETSYFLHVLLSGSL